MRLSGGNQPSLSKDVALRAGTVYVDQDVDGARLDVRGADLLDGTPVLDLKPYVKGYDRFASASAGWIDELGEPASSPDRLDYWPPPAHLR